MWGKPRPMLKLLTVRRVRVREESRDFGLDWEEDRPLFSFLPREEDDEEPEACPVAGRRFESLRGLEGVTTMPLGTSGKALLSLAKGGKGGSGRSASVKEDGCWSSRGDETE